MELLKNEIYKLKGNINVERFKIDESILEDFKKGNCIIIDRHKDLAKTIYLRDIIHYTKAIINMSVFYIVENKTDVYDDFVEDLNRYNLENIWELLDYKLEGLANTTIYYLEDILVREGYTLYKNDQVKYLGEADDFYIINIWGIGGRWKLPAAFISNLILFKKTIESVAQNNHGRFKNELVNKVRNGKLAIVITMCHKEEILQELALLVNNKKIKLGGLPDIVHYINELGCWKSAQTTNKPTLYLHEFLSTH